jgi:RNA polymerase sigma-70 factor (ECF subfamily)
MDQQTEGVICEGLRRGEPQAWAKLYDSHAERLFREVGRMVGGDPADVADVVQEVFLAVARSARQFDPKRGTLWLWLLGIARNQVALYWRKRTPQLAEARRWWSSLNGRAKAWVAHNADPPAEILEAKELAVLVRATLAQLPIDYQALLTTKYLDGASAEQIAAQTRSTAEAVRAKLMRARRAFREAYLHVVHPSTVEQVGSCHE